MRNRVFSVSPRYENQYLHNLTNIMLPIIPSYLLFLDLKHSSSLLSFKMKLKAFLQLAAIPGFRFDVSVCVCVCVCCLIVCFGYWCWSVRKC